MIKKTIFFVFLGVMGLHANDIDQNRVNSFLYGPYLNDAPVPVIAVDIPQLFKNNPCNTDDLNKVANDFFALGKWRGSVGVDQQLNIAVCAKRRVTNAASLLEKLVYASQNVTAVATANRQLKGIIYNSAYILSIASYYPKLFRAIPDSHPDYLNMIEQLLPKNPQVFNNITLRYKRHPWVTNALFNVKYSYDDIYKHMAIQYTNDVNQRKRFVMHNGLLYLELPVEKRTDPYLAYHAYVQNDFVYPFIPTKIKDAFKEDGAIMVPRYMTKLVMLKQAFYRKLNLVWTPIKESLFKSKKDDVNMDIIADEDGNIEVTPNAVAATNTDESFEDEVVEETIHKPVEFRNERTVVTDIRIINKIENKKKRRLLNLWRIAQFGDGGEVFVAMFRPQGKENLGTIVVKQNERYMFSDYAAVFSMDGDSIWRIKDDGTFSSKTFSLDHVTKSDDGIWHFRFSWKGEYTTNEFDLVEEGGMLVKEFVNYYFE